MRDSLLKLIEVSIRVIRLLDEASIKLYPYDDGAFVSIVARKIINPEEIITEAKGLQVCFYAMDNLIEVRIYESI